MQVWDVDHGSDDEHSDKPTAADAEREFESALDDDRYLRIDEMLGLLSSIDERSDVELVPSLADRWLQRALQDDARTPEQRADTLVDLLDGLASKGLHDRAWVPLVASFARTLTSDVRAGLLDWLMANA